jgi:hypothetical protein
LEWPIHLTVIVYESGLRPLVGQWGWWTEIIRDKLAKMHNVTVTLKIQNITFVDVIVLPFIVRLIKFFMEYLSTCM